MKSVVTLSLSLSILLGPPVVRAQVVQAQGAGEGRISETSINFYDPATGRWNQLWVGGSGQILRLVRRTGGRGGDHLGA